MVVTEVRVLGQEEDRCLLVDFVVLGVQDLDLAGGNEVQFLDARLVAHECLAWLGNFAIELHNYLVDEAIFALLKEVVESLEQLTELVSAVHQFRLDL